MYLTRSRNESSILPLLTCSINSSIFVLYPPGYVATSLILPTIPAPLALCVTCTVTASFSIYTIPSPTGSTWKGSTLASTPMFPSSCLRVALFDSII